MYVVPWDMLRKGLAGCAGSIDPDAPVTVSGRLLALLLEAALLNEPFDEAAYLEANPDVAKAIKREKCESARAHYLAAGYFEGRGTAFAFDEAWYLERNPDVAQAVRSGDAASALQHFRESGRREWRSPNHAVDSDLARWRRAIAPAGRGAEPVVVPLRSQAGGRT